MCTVTYLPSRNGFTLTHNRDEAPARSSVSIAQEQTAGGEALIFPRDAKAGGTWFGAAENGKTACLLNGAFVRHQHLPPYRRSRGLMMLDFFEFERPDDFFEQYDFEGIEPFTFLYFDAERVVELRWDEQQRHLKKLPAEKPHFWCSSTLYPADMQEKRARVFEEWLAAPGAHDPPALIDLHLHGSVGDVANNFVMQRERVRTVSVTQVVIEKNIATMTFLELLEGNRDERRLLLRNG